MADPAPQDMPAAFIPPPAERPASRTPPRMPRIDEFPVPAQNQIRANRGELPEEHPEKRRLTLLQRLASVGLGRRDEEAQPEPARAATPQTIDRMPPPPTRPAPQPRTPDPVSEYAKRPPAPQSAHQGLDLHGRQAAPVHKPVD